VLDARGIAPIRHATGKPLGQLKPPLDIAQQQDAAIRRQPTAIEGNAHLLAANGWKSKREKAIVVHGGCGAPRSRC